MTIWTSESIDDGLVKYEFYDDGSVRCECNRGGKDVDTFMRGDKRAQEHIKDWKLELEVHKDYNNKAAIESINQLLSLLTK